MQHLPCFTVLGDSLAQYNARRRVIQEDVPNDRQVRGAFGRVLRCFTSLSLRDKRDKLHHFQSVGGQRSSAKETRRPSTGVGTKCGFSSDAISWPRRGVGSGGGPGRVRNCGGRRWG